MRSTLSKKPERKPPFFRGGPPNNRGGGGGGWSSTGDTEGAEPKTSHSTERGHTPGRQRPNSDTQKNSELVHVCVKDICQSTLITQMAHVGVRPQTQRDHLPPAGRLKGHISTWKVITSDPWVVDTVRGYRVDLLSKLQQRVRPHTPQYSVEQSQLIVEEVKELLGKGEVHNPRGGFCLNLFLVPKKDSGQRPVINLKALNSFVQTEHFKMEGIHTLRDLVNPEAKVDLKDAYFAVPIHLRFKCYQFQCLPFSLSSAPWVFTKTLKPALALLREMGVRLIA